MEGWDLQAVVRGCSSTSNELGFSNFLNSPLDLDEILSFFDEQKNGFDYNSSVSPQSNQSSSTSLMSVLSFCGDQVIKQEDKVQKQLSLSESSHAPSPLSVIKLKRSKVGSSKKNQQKRVVKRVAEDAVSSDKWAWRKYGQKPIKGSPFPRSYYRCSSLKGCMARKQVERSKEDPSVFIITYTADHCHPHPARQNSLAGTTRTKDPNLAKQALDPNQTLVKYETSPSDTIPNPDPMDHIVHHVITSIKTELLDEQDEQMGMPNMVFREDFFTSLEDFEGMLFDQFIATPPSQIN